MQIRLRCKRVSLHMLACILVVVQIETLFFVYIFTMQINWEAGCLGEVCCQRPVLSSLCCWLFPMVPGVVRKDC
jgi:hypothetical protein